MAFGVKGVHFVEAGSNEAGADGERLVSGGRSAVIARPLRLARRTAKRYAES